jgi:hypothetical protein
VTLESFAVAGVGESARGWYGFGTDASGHYRFVVAGNALHAAPAEPELLIAVAIAYFAGGLPEPPEGHAATHADIAALVSAVADGVPQADRRRLLLDARDAIDDGLAADAVMALLGSALAGPLAADPVAAVVARAMELLEDE